MSRSLSLTGLTLLALLAPTAWSADPAGELHHCAGIDAATERLACYDKLAGRPSPATSRPSQPVRSDNPTPAPTSAFADGPQATQPPASVGGPTTPADEPLTKETFGLYAREHPAAPRAFPELTAAVTRVSTDASGATLISLEGNQVWRIADADPLLAKGDMVNIKRGKLGSFLMTTPTGREHRARRVK